MHAPVGRWQKGKDIYWYAKGNSEAAINAEEEKRRLKELDEELINSALGIKTKPKQYTTTNELDTDELKVLLSRGSTGRTEVDAERVEGLGKAPVVRHELSGKILSQVEKDIIALKEASNKKGSVDNSHFSPVSSNNQAVKENSNQSLELYGDLSIPDSHDSIVDRGNSLETHKKEKKRKNDRESEGEGRNKSHKHSKHTHSKKSSSHSIDSDDYNNRRDHTHRHHHHHKDKDK